MVDNTSSAKVFLIKAGFTVEGRSNTLFGVCIVVPLGKDRVNLEFPWAQREGRWEVWLHLSQQQICVAQKRGELLGCRNTVSKVLSTFRGNLRTLEYHWLEWWDQGCSILILQELKLLHNWVEAHLELSLEVADHIDVEVIGGMSSCVSVEHPWNIFAFLWRVKRILHSA